MGDLGVGNICCGDCNSTDPEWAVINRGLLVCNDCCFVHRSLGPQYSRIKSLKESNWDPKLRKTVMTLASGSANHVWEHLLMDPSKMDKDSNHAKKPSAHDSLEAKRKFITQKHFHFQFVPRTQSDQIEAKSQELHSTVRTGALDTTLRLLAGGADPNFFHPEKGTRPMHVAARNGQALQVELLHLHGAHSSAGDYLGQSPMEHAMAAGHKELAQRIIQLRYDLTDQLSLFACGDKPDHSSSKHILVPSIKAKNSKHEADFKNMPFYLLEQISADIFDEVERRQIEKVVVAKFGSQSHKFSIAFLPVNPHYQSVRNQARQKFARLTNEELCCLISFVLTECENRHCNSGSSEAEAEKSMFLRSNSGTNVNNTPKHVPAFPLNLTEDDDYPLYDSVASDEDLILAEQQIFLAQNTSKLDETLLINNSMVNPVSTFQLNAYKDNLLLSKLMEAETKIQGLEEINQDLKQEVLVLQRMARYCIQENLEMKSTLDSLSASPISPSIVGDFSEARRANMLKHSRPSSMCELPPLGEKQTNHSKEHYIRAGKLFGVAPIAQEATQRTVELIKLLIEYTTSLDIQGIKITVRDIYDVVHEMAQALMVIREVKSRPDVKESLGLLCYQVLKLRHQAPNLITSPRLSQKELVPKIKQLCFEVGAAMKSFMSLIVSPPDESLEMKR